MTLLDRARAIADEVLFPAAGAVDRAERVPEEHFELLDREGLYDLGDLDVDALGPITEALAGGCLATAFVWIQHRAVGRRGAGIARSAARPSGLVVRPAEGAYSLDGSVPWVTGWEMLDILQVGAYDPADDTVKFLLVDARPSASLSAVRLDLIAAGASRTVTLTFSDHVVEAGRFTHALPLQEWQRREAPGSALNGFLALGVASRCVRLMDSPPSLIREVDRCRADLIAADAAATPAARAAVSELAVRCAAALAVHTGSRSVLRGSAAERLAREAAFLLVFGTRPAIRDSLLSRLTA
jgi:alkylation response protein AidB-like acyl-CoA dehydrogenase